MCAVIVATGGITLGFCTTEGLAKNILGKYKTQWEQYVRTKVSNYQQLGSTWDFPGLSEALNHNTNFDSPHDSSCMYHSAMWPIMMENSPTAYGLKAPLTNLYTTRGPLQRSMERVLSINFANRLE